MKNARKLPQWVENIVEKWEIARNEQFLFFPQCFQGTFTADTWKTGLIWETDLHWCMNNKYGFFEIKYYFYAAKTQKGNDGIVLFENCGLNWAMKLIEVQNAHLTKADMYP